MQRQAIFPVTHSILSAATLLREVLPDYGVEQPLACQLLNRGLNDTYLVLTSGERYILRAYRAGWRSDAAIRYELDALNHLATRGLAVSTPVRRRRGGFVRVVQAPEGRRQIVLFTYARGKAGYDHEDYATLYGRMAAEIHHASDDFFSRHRRFRIDLVELLDKPLATIRPRLAHRPQDWHYLQDLAERLRRRVDALPASELETGFCHGDLHGGNVHLEGETLTAFDFDCCGPGWRAYDVAVFLWGCSLRSFKKGEHRWEQFLHGYTQRRRLPALDLAAVPLFVAIRHFWLLGLHTGNGQDWGFGWMDDGYFDRSLKFLRRWERRHLRQPSPLSQGVREDS